MPAMKITHLLAALAIALAGTSAQALTVDEAYAALKYKRVKFDPATATMKKEQAESLQRLLAIADRGVILRAEAKSAHADGNQAAIKANLAGYDKLIADLEKEKSVEAIEPARERVLKALASLREFLSTRTETGPLLHNELRNAPLVRESHDALRRAYSILMSAYTSDTRPTKTAIAASLGGMDFF
jgi:hypothetical protein